MTTHVGTHHQMNGTGSYENPDNWDENAYLDQYGALFHYGVRLKDDTSALYFSVSSR